MSEDPRVYPAIGAEIEVLGAKKSSRRRVVSMTYKGSVVMYEDLRTGNKKTTTLKAWRQWAFPGRVVSAGKLEGRA